MKNKAQIVVFALALPLILAAVSMFFDSETEFQIWNFVVNSKTISVSMLFVVAVILLLISFTIIFESLFAKIIFLRSEAGARASDIYRTASKCGGTIHATHIFSNEGSASGDFAFIELKNHNPNIQLAVHRIMAFKSQNVEREWVEQMYTKLTDRIEKNLHTLEVRPLTFPSLIKDILPRVNLLLYRSLDGKEHKVFVGLDHIGDDSEGRNFALYFKSRRVYQILLFYLNKITHSGRFRSHSSLQAYRTHSYRTNYSAGTHDVVGRLYDYAEGTRAVRFVGIFGSLARGFLGIDSTTRMQKTDADVDLIVVFDTLDASSGGPFNHRKIREEISDLLGTERVDISWGPGGDRCYPFRNDNKISVDIEILENGSGYYLTNRLLGYSIFNSCMPVYDADHMGASHHIGIPLDVLEEKDRWELVINDRQGLRHFRSEIEKNSDGLDPRRLISHMMRNTCWAITGMWASTDYEALQFLQVHRNWKDLLQNSGIAEIMAKSQREIEMNRNDVFSVVLQGIDLIVKNHRSGLDGTNRD